MEKKNNDYSGGLTSDDALANFKMSNALGMSPVMGLLLRIQDKMMRIKTFATDGSLNVADESVYDAFEDIINYAILGKALMIENRIGPANKQTEPSTDSIEEELKKLAALDCANSHPSSNKQKPRDVPLAYIRWAVDHFSKGFIYYGESEYFIEQANKYAQHLSEKDISDNMQVCEFESDWGEVTLLLIGVKKESCLFDALTKGESQPTE